MSKSVSKHLEEPKIGKRNNRNDIRDIRGGSTWSKFRSWKFMLLLHVIVRYQSTMMYETSFRGLALTNCAYTKDSMNGRQRCKDEMHDSKTGKESGWKSHLPQTNPLTGRRVVGDDLPGTIMWWLVFGCIFAQLPATDFHTQRRSWTGSCCGVAGACPGAKTRKKDKRTWCGKGKIKMDQQISRVSTRSHTVYVRSGN
jgi:hypothetical protein